ncbi:little elongation complex subunit 1 [Perognathus longimembris pacificus]|uniref:little elongation complex subunit 1 n=1 Tax=Perognathus longimembris pacificus TaxID=214514 RepID=UPI0020187A49|nr:little elongation complex subunit 1 [Perognathus longimembris pacificus]
MMPGETHSAATGAAADLVQCQGCASLQQNLNEYVEALITLKQKIINTDNLLTEYQKKCDELQFARRENSTLHHQVEQMLQKISPLQKCQEELGTLKAELEEKKSSLKLYQASHQEYTRVKEECLKSDAQKKKLEAKVKKLEEAAVKQTQDFKQLRNEKKILEKEFKKTQERLDEFSKQKNKKGLRHIGTQISSDSYGSIDKRKVKLLLKELWLCVNTAQRLPGDVGRRTPEKFAQDDSSFSTSREDGTPSPSRDSPPRAAEVPTCLAELSMEVEESSTSCAGVQQERPFGATPSPHPVSSEGRSPEVLMQGPGDADRADSPGPVPMVDEDLQAAIDFFRLPLPLVSPVPSPPLTSSPNHRRPLPSLLAPETYFGEYTDSSDNDLATHGDSDASEDDIADAQACFGLSRKNNGHGAKSKEAAQVLSKFAVRGVKASAAPLGEPSTAAGAAPRDLTGGRGSRAAEAERRAEAGPRSAPAPAERVAERVLPGPSRSLSVEKLSGGPPRGGEPAAASSGLYFMPLVKRPLKELLGSDEEASSSSKKLGSPLSGLPRCAFAGDMPSTSDFGSFPRTPREPAKDQEDEQESTSESSDSEDDDPGDGMGPGGPSSSFSHPQPSRLQYMNDAGRPARAEPPEQPRVQGRFRARNMLPAPSEPPEPSVQGSSLGSRLCPPSPGPETPTQASTLALSVLRRMTEDGQSERQDSRPASPSSTSSQSCLSETDSGFDKSTSWHQGDSVRRGGEESPSVTSEQAVPASQNRGSSAMRELPGEHASPASLLLSPVSLTTQPASPKQSHSVSVESGQRENSPVSLTTQPASPKQSHSVSVESGQRENSPVSLTTQPASPKQSQSVSVDSGQHENTPLSLTTQPASPKQGQSVSVDSGQRENTPLSLTTQPASPKQSQSVSVDSGQHENTPLSLTTQPASPKQGQSDSVDSGQRENSPVSLTTQPASPKQSQSVSVDSGQCENSPLSFTTQPASPKQSQSVSVDSGQCENSPLSFTTQPASPKQGQSDSMDWGPHENNPVSVTTQPASPKQGQGVSVDSGQRENSSVSVTTQPASPQQGQSISVDSGQHVNSPVSLTTQLASPKQGHSDSMDWGQRENSPVSVTTQPASPKQGQGDSVDWGQRENSPVSVTIQPASPKLGQGDSVDWGLHEKVSTSALENCNSVTDDASVAEHANDRAETAGNIAEGPVKRSASPEFSVSYSKLDLGSQGDSLSAENFDCSTSRKLSSPEDSLCQSQGSSKGAAVHGEGPGEAAQPPRAPPATGPDSSAMESPELPPAEPALSEETPCGHASGPSSDTSAMASGSAATQQSASELSPSTSPAPRASPPPFLTAGTALGSAPSSPEEKTQASPSGGPPGTPSCRPRVAAGGEEDTGTEASEPSSCSEGEPEAGHARRASGEEGGAAAQGRPSPDVGYLTLALQDFNINTFPDIDRLSTSEVAMFLESCQLKDCSSGDSVSECSSKGTLNKEMSKDLEPSGASGEKCEQQLCEEATVGASEEWAEPEEEDGSSEDPRQLVQCSLETLSDVLAKTGPELEANCGDSGAGDIGTLPLLSANGSAATEGLKESSPPEGASSLAPHSPEPPLLVPEARVEDSPPGSGGCHSEHARGRLTAGPAAAVCADIGRNGRAGPADSSAPTSDSATESRMEQSSGDESEAFQSHLSAATSEVTDTHAEKDQSLGVEREDSWVVGGAAASPDVGTPRALEEGEDDSLSPTSTENSPETSPAAPPFQEPPSGSAPTGPQGGVSSNGPGANFDKSRLRNRPVKPSIWISSQIYDQTFEAQNVASDHTYCNSRPEPFCKNKTRSKISHKDQSNKPVKTSVSKGDVHPGDPPQPLPGEGSPKSQKGQPQPVLAHADTSMSTDGSLDTLSKIRQEVGPPLPPLLAPLIATPPRAAPPLSPLASSPSSPASPPGKMSPASEIPVPPVLSPWPEDPPSSSPLEPSPSPSSAAGGRILSSPLQFCAATPKHALPVPGRLPPCAPGPAAVGGPPENSVKILDTMYPELSARARTLSILKGNMQLTRGTAADGKAPPGRLSALLGLKAITSTATAFVKTGSGSGGDGSQQAPGGKRASSASVPRSAKRLRLDSESPEPEPKGGPGPAVPGSLPEDPQRAEAAAEESLALPSSPIPPLPVSPKDAAESRDHATVVHALKKVAESSFDLLPVIRSHVYVGNISRNPVMRDQEKEVVYEFSTTKKHLAECLLRSILSELKLPKKPVDHSYIHALCRVYVGICRQLGDLERARLFCYSLLKEDFPESEKLALFIANMWHDVFVSQSVISKAMQLVARQRAKGEVLNCLRAFLNWEKSAPVDVGIMVSKLLLTIQLCPKTEFQSSEKYGEDLSGNTWEYIFAIDLLCCHQKWIWTHDNIISKELWPVMDKWIKYRKGHTNIAFTPDVIIASILRLIGRLGQLGLKEGFPTAVKNISSVIGTFIQHAQDEDIPWGVQLAAVYALCDLSPSSPAETAQVLEGWRRQAAHSIPAAVLSYLEEVGALGQGGAGGAQAP